MDADPRTPRKRLKQPLEIGWCELVDLPELGLERIRAKIDTGAATSSIHATRIVPVEREGRLYVEFSFHKRPGQPMQRYLAPAIEQRRVRSSNGQWQRRYVIETTMRLGDVTWLGHMTLANRQSMNFPILVGRRALRRGFLVNSAKRWLLGRPERENHR